MEDEHVTSSDDASGTDASGNAIAMIARCARHQHPELFQGEPVAVECVAANGAEPIPPGFNTEGLVPEEMPYAVPAGPTFFDERASERELLRAA
jgi:hypothetical protein